MSAEIPGNAAAELAAGNDLTPGEHLRAEIERLGLDQVAVSQATGVSRQSINNIVNGRQPISRAMAGKLGRLTGRSSDYWLRASFPRSAASAGAAERAFGVGILVNHQIVRAVQNGIIGIDPFDAAQVRLASVELTLDNVLTAADGKPIDIGGGERFVLKSGQSVNAATREWLEIPHDYIGRAGAIAGPAGTGILILHALQISPGFRGNLRFSVFNAGPDDFELRGGDPIVAIELMPLAATPVPDGNAARTASGSRDAHHRDPAASGFRNDICGRLIREAVRAKAQTEIGADGATARIADLNIEILDASADAARDAAVRAALGGLKTLRDQPGGAPESRGKYDAFFGDVAERLYLSGEQTRRALAVLGLPADRGDTLIASLRNGADAVVPLPSGSARVSLRQLARQLHEDPLDLILMLTGAKPYRALE